MRPPGQLGSQPTNPLPARDPKPTGIKIPSTNHEPKAFFRAALFCAAHVENWSRSLDGCMHACAVVKTVASWVGKAERLFIEYDTQTHTLRPRDAHRYTSDGGDDAGRRKCQGQEGGCFLVYDHFGSRPVQEIVSRRFGNEGMLPPTFVLGVTGARELKSWPRYDPCSVAGAGMHTVYLYSTT